MKRKKNRTRTGMGENWGACSLEGEKSGGERKGEGKGGSKPEGLREEKGIEKGKPRERDHYMKDSGIRGVGKN